VGVEQHRNPALSGRRRVMVKDIGSLLAEEAEAAEEHRDDDVPLVRSRRPAKEPTQVYSLRVPVEKLEELRRLAEERHLTPSALMRSWIIERLEQESSGDNFLAVVRRAVRDELVEIWPIASAHRESVSTADRTSVASGVKGRKSGASAAKSGASAAKGRKSGATRSRKVGTAAAQSRGSEALPARNRKSAASG
jgi:hypothetical protein